MSRRSGFFAIVAQASREAAKQRRLAEVAERQRARELQRRLREQGRYQAQADKAQRQEYLAARALQAEEANTELEQRVQSLADILATGMKRSGPISFASLKLPEVTAPFQPPTELATPKPAPRYEDFAKWVKPASLLEKAIRSKRYDNEIQSAFAAFQHARDKHRQLEEKRLQDLGRLHEQYETWRQAQLSEIRGKNADIDSFEEAYRSGEPGEVVQYFTMVLERSEYPEGFLQNFRVAFASTSRELVIDYEIPTPSVVPSVSEYRYIKSKDAFEEKARKAAEIKELYQDVVSSIPLRTMHEVFSADQADQVAVVTFNAFVNTVDPATGRDIKPYLISVRATRERFLEIDLARVDRKACLRNLGAQVSAQPTELQPVKPLIEFDMVAYSCDPEREFSPKTNGSFAIPNSVRSEATLAR